ncbi:GNAT family N-acetyltransferase [Cellulosimicrobium sp. CUA-896]|uniref:GNAT family N-acetyltransferase n=1 Tax=Cellulosimicrobium sp. CUA-896 TaxID=1517881 RepID=UPI000959C219|nr:GNAT family N-acetyltransferase [Cellulosimicrobium sp. CUA-896]OLT52093.1 GNAT family N-acetyltransferase [Cellulosimicrobium sp. CUA-896]
MSEHTDERTVDVVEVEDRFEGRLPDGTVAGFAEFSLQDGAVVFTHTEVDPAYEGEGVGSALVAGALDQVRESGRRVVALCPFVKAYVARHREYQDLLQG